MIIFPHSIGSIKWTKDLSYQLASIKYPSIVMMSLYSGFIKSIFLIELKSFDEKRSIASSLSVHIITFWRITSDTRRDQLLKDLSALIECRTILFVSRMWIPSLSHWESTLLWYRSGHWFHSEFNNVSRFVDIWWCIAYPYWINKGGRTFHRVSGKTERKPTDFSKIACRIHP
jgi:hypothetical protein